MFSEFVLQKISNNQSLFFTFNIKEEALQKYVEKSYFLKLT
jgi:hypothetical protein